MTTRDGGSLAAKPLTEAPPNALAEWLAEARELALPCMAREQWTVLLDELTALVADLQAEALKEGQRRAKHDNARSDDVALNLLGAQEHADQALLQLDLSPQPDSKLFRELRAGVKAVDEWLGDLRLLLDVLREGRDDA